MKLSEKNNSFLPRQTGGAGIRGAGFQWRPVVWWPGFTSLLKTEINIEQEQTESTEKRLGSGKL